MDGQPIYIALIDLTCNLDFLELVKSGLLAALEAVSPASLFGLVTFSHKVKCTNAAISSFFCVAHSCCCSGMALDVKAMMAEVTTAQISICG